MEARLHSWLLADACWVMLQGVLPSLAVPQACSCLGRTQDQCCNAEGLPSPQQPCRTAAT